MTQTLAVPKKIVSTLMACMLVAAMFFVGELRSTSPTVAYAATKSTITVAAKLNYDTSLGGAVITLAPMHKTSKRINIKDSLKSNGAIANIYSSDITPAQRFRLVATSKGYFKLINVWSGKALAVSGGKAKSGAAIAQITASNSKAQQWRFAKLADGSYRILSRLSSKYELSVKGGKKSNGTAIVLSKLSKKAKSHRFAITKITAPLASGVYEIKSALSDKSLDIANASKSNKAQLEVNDPTNTLAQRWLLKYNKKTGYYTIKSDYSGKRVAVKGNANKNNTKVQQRNTKNVFGQLWSLVPLADGKYALRSATGGKALKVQSSSKANGADAVIYKYKKSTKAEQWVFAATSSIFGMPITAEQMAKLQVPYAVNNNKKATRAVVLAALDPAVLGTTSTQFADLRGSGGLSAAQLNTFIKSTASGKSGVLYKKGSAFKAAANKYGINEAYLLGHAILESGWGTSVLAKGQKVAATKIGGKTYPAGTYYNLFGWGAFDSSPVSSGLTYAIKNGWNSVDKAISGAAQVISANYINAGAYPQYTLYGMRWHYSSTADTKVRSAHQYATDAGWANKIAVMMDEIYVKAKSHHALRYEVVSYAKQ